MSISTQKFPLTTTAGTAGLSLGALYCALLLSLPLALTACPTDDGPADDEVGESTETETETESTDTETTTETTETESTETETTETETETTETGPAPIIYPDADVADYVRVDRMGWVGVNMIFIAAKDDFNQGDPVTDPVSSFSLQYLETETNILMALLDDLADLDLTACLLGACVVNMGLFPDSVLVTVASPPGFPNGRKLSDPVMDRLLSLMLLDQDEHPLDFFVGMLNPVANDVPFLDEFPYLGEPH